MLYGVYTTERFEKESEKLNPSDKLILEKFYKRLKENPYSGDQLQYPNLREKRIREKRVYFLVYDDLTSVLLVAIGGKKEQQATINHIINHFDEFKIYLKRKLAETE